MRARQLVLVATNIVLFGMLATTASVTVTVASSAPLLTVTKSGTGSGTVTSSAGIDCGANCSATFSSGTSVTLTATPAAGSTFARWSGACTGTGTCTVTLDASKNLTATFNVVPFAAATSVNIMLASGGTGGIITLITTITFNPPDVGKPGAVYVVAWVPFNALDALNVPLIGPFVRLVQLTSSGWRLVVNGQLIPYASGVLGDQLAAQTILSNTNMTNLTGAQFCLGYGTSAADMIATGNVELIATVTSPYSASTATGICPFIATPTTAGIADCVFNWAERVYPNLFAPAGAVAQTLTPYYYRYYAGTNAYLGTSSADNELYYLGPASGNTLFDVGPLSDWRTTAGCPLPWLLPSIRPELA